MLAEAFLLGAAAGQCYLLGGKIAHKMLAHLLGVWGWLVNLYSWIFTLI